MSRIAFFVALAALSLPAVSLAALSGNLIGGGDFENTAFLKNEYSCDHLNTEIGGHRFDRDNDYGKWLGHAGPPSYYWNGYYGQGGFSTWDDPDTDASPLEKTRDARDLGTNNRSVDPYDVTGTNHIMETIAYNTKMAQWVQAPANQATGPMQLSFDMFYNNWDSTMVGYPADVDRFMITVYGSNFEPPHNVGTSWSPVNGGAYDSGIGSMISPTGGADDVNYTDPATSEVYRSKVLGRWGWGAWFTRSIGDPETGGWKHLDSSNTSVGWYDIAPDQYGYMIIPVELTETFDYYSVTIDTVVYRESHEYFWAYTGSAIVGYRESDNSPALGFDNIDFRVSVANAVLRGDVNLDGLVNALDISPFVSKLTSGAYQAEADINQDNLVNALDISGFVTCLVNGACAGEAGGSTVPEPATLTLVLAGLLLVRRR